MGTLFAYSLVVSVVLTAVWALSGLAHGGSPASRRALLLTSYVIALLAFMPAMAIEPRPSMEVAPTLPTAEAIATTAQNFATAGDAGSFSHLRILLIIYIIGLTATLTLTLRSAISIARLRRGCEKRRLKGLTVYVSERPVAPFSFGRFMVVSREDAENTAILKHEASHIRHRHTADMVLAQMVAAICWYCPAAWAMRRMLQLEHEFQADSDVVSAGTGVREYALMLVSRAATPHGPSMANGMQASDLGRRIKMLKQPRPARSRMKALLPVTALNAAILLSAIPAVGSALEQVSGITVSRGSRTDSANAQYFVVYGATAPRSGNFPALESYENSAPDLENVDGIVLEKAGAIFVSHRQTLRQLAPDVRTFLVDGKQMAPDEFYRATIGRIQKVTVSGRAAIVHTAANIDDGRENHLQNALNANK